MYSPDTKNNSPTKSPSSISKRTTTKVSESEQFRMITVKKVEMEHLSTSVLALQSDAQLVDFEHTDCDLFRLKEKAHVAATDLLKEQTQNELDPNLEKIAEDNKHVEEMLEENNEALEAKIR